MSIHIVNRFENATGGSELRALNLFHALSPVTSVQLWSTADVAAGLPQRDIRRIETKRLRFPRRGTLVFVGTYFKPGNWLRLSFPKRVIIHYNTPDPDRLSRLIQEVKVSAHVDAEVRYASQMMKDSVGGSGPVEISLFDAAAFTPQDRKDRQHFVIGRMSRDEDIKHHHEDAALYKALGALGVKVRIMGPFPALRENIEGVAGVELLNCGQESAPDFLQSLDCFYYRTNAAWSEPWGRVVVEAMAMGLPVVAHTSGGYRALIETGKNGFLFDVTAEAESLILALRSDAQLRKTVGATARANILASHGLGVREALVRSYL